LFEVESRDQGEQQCTHTLERINVAPLGTVHQPGVFQMCVSGAPTWAPAMSYLAGCIESRRLVYALV
jgi:hypothetical protein